MATNKKPSARSKRSAAAAKKPSKLLSGGNPQITKGDGDAPVQAWIAAIPDWKRDVALRLDALVVRALPNVAKAVRWNSPFYGVAGQGWFLGMHCIAKYMKVAFFRGAQLSPMPPVASKQKDVRYLHVHAGEAIDEAQFVRWVLAAAQLPGEPCF